VVWVDQFDGSILEEPVMPRLARLQFIPFGWYYVALRSVAERQLVTSHAELMTVLKVLRRTLRATGARLHAGYVAEREMHLALQVGQVPLRVVTGGFQHEYARIVNRTRHEHGSLFRSHYHELLIQHQHWLVPLVHHIHWIRRLEVADASPNGLWWSSDAVYRGTMKQHWVTTSVVLRMLTRGAYNRRVQEEVYRGMFEEAPEPDRAALFRRGTKEDPRLLGDSEFIAEVGRGAVRRHPSRNRRARHLEGDLPAVVMQVVEQFNALCDARLPRHQAGAWRRLVTFENVRSKLRKRPLPVVRALIASYLIEHGITTATQAARFFGFNPRSVSVGRRRSYEMAFRGWFGTMPDILFSPGWGDRSVTSRDELREQEPEQGSEPEQDPEPELKGCAEPADLCGP
jgi:hypothetical protein